MQAIITILIDGMIYASWIFLVAVGLTMIFGVMKILNIAHGSMYAFGAYAAATTLGWLFAGLGEEPQVFWALLSALGVLLASAVLVGIVLGLVMERGLLRFMYGMDEVLMVLVTFATFLILEDLIMVIWGTDAYFAFELYSLPGNLDVMDINYPNYELSLIGVAMVVGGLLWWGINGTKWGKLMLAVIHDREMAEAFGINVTRVFTVTFILGAILGALGGAFTAPMISVTPGMGVEVIVLAFAIVAIGGMGSIPGAVVGSLGVGIVRATAVHLMPELELFIIYAVMALVLAFRPQGLFGRAEARKI